MAEHRIGKADNFLKDGEMTRVELEGKAVLVVRTGGQYHAVAGKCSHYGARLDHGVLKGNTVICPWHHACFDVRSGERLEPPALNDLAHYPLRVDGGEVVVTLPKDNQTEPQGKADPAVSQTFVIIGGGAAGSAAAEELRRTGFQGKIVMVSDVPDLPVDRPNLSKDYLEGKADPSWMPLRPDSDWYTARGIELRLNAHVSGIDPKGHKVNLADGSHIAYDRLLLATGGTPRKLDIPGADLGGVFLLRTQANADQIVDAAAKRKNAVIVGASFIALESAAALAGGRGISVTIVAPEEVPFARILGSDIGKMLQKEHEENGIKFRLKSEIKQFVGNDGYVTGIELKDGEVIPAEFVLAGVGVRPATDFLQGAGLKMEDRDHSVMVSEALQTSDPHIYAAGDIARWQEGSSSVRIEHWRVAQQHGIVAARNMLGKSDSVRQHVPFFWTHQWKTELRYVGHAERWDEIIYREGTPEQKQFIALYVAGGKLLAAAGVERDKQLDAIELIMRENKPLSLRQMRDSSFDLVAYALTR